MERLLKDSIFGMANLTSKRTGLPCGIWSDHKGSKQDYKHNEPGVKIEINGDRIPVSIEPNPRVLNKSAYDRLKKSEKSDFQVTVKYVGDSYELFLKHFNDDDSDSFDDDDLKDALRERGVYR